MGVIEAFGISFFDDKFRDIITFGVLILVLLFRPGGLFGRVPLIANEPLTGTFLGQGRPRTIPLWGVWAILGVAALLPLFADGYTLVVVTQVMIYAVIGVALTVLSGSAGQITLGQAGPVAVGAYTSAILVKFMGWPFLLALPMAGIFSAVIASVLTAPLWRLKGHYVSIATLGVGVVIVAIIRNWDGLTRGAYGITAIPPPDLFGWKVATPASYYLIDLAVLVVTLLVITRLRSSHLGKVISAVGSDEVAAAASGVSGRNYKALAFAVAAFFAGIAGSLMAHQYSYLEPSVFDLTMALLALTVIVLGGVNSPAGAVVGALILVGLPEFLRIAPSVRIVGYGVLLLLAIRFRPQGLWMVKA
jgi:branched-chain amino acid transport system permease protein